MKYPHLFSPVNIGTMQVRNRLMHTAMNPGAGYTERQAPNSMIPTERLFKYYEERAKGGLGAISISLAFFPMNPESHCSVGACDEAHLPHLTELARRINSHGCKAIGMAFCLHEWSPSADEPCKAWGPSDIEVLKGVGPFEPMTKEHIRIYVEQVGRMAKLIKDAGWDAIEIMAGLGSTLSRFLSKATNNRTDEYGGSVENRTRFLVECVRAAKEAAGEDFPVLVRWSPLDLIKNGNEIEDAYEIIPIIEAAGVNAHNIGVGWHETPQPLTTKEVPEAGFVWISEQVKKVAKSPVITAYRNTDPASMEQIIASGRADLIGGARFNVADPEFANKAMEGRDEDIQKCLCCCRCIDDVVAQDKPLKYCSVNPRLYDELGDVLTPVANPKNVVVVGSGIAGLNAAFAAHKKGHKVTVYEKGPRVGGCLTMSAIFSPLYERLLDYFKVQLKKTPEIKVKLNTDMTPELADSLNADIIIVAVGGHPKNLNVPGADGKNIVKSHDFMEMINGRAPKKKGLVNKIMWNGGAVFLKRFASPSFMRNMMWMPWPFGKRVGIIGGGLPGCELGTVMVNNKRKVYMLEENKRIGYDVGNSERFHVTRHLKQTAVLEPLTEVTEIAGDKIKAHRKDGTDFEVEVDTVAVTLGFDKNMDLAEALQSKAPVVIAIGDCSDPKRMPDAAKAGYLAGKAIE